MLGPLRAGSRGPADQHLSSGLGWHCPSAVSIPGQAGGVGTCQLEPAQVRVPACPGVFLLPPDVPAARSWVAQLCREGRNKMGAVSQRKALSASALTLPLVPQQPLVTGVCGGAWLCSESRAGPQPSRASGRPHVHTAGGFSSASLLPKGNSASESETRWLQRLCLCHPPNAPSCPHGPCRASSRCCNTCSDSCAAHLL